MALGYLNRPELTAERFLPDPFRGVPHARLYKTGDQVRWRADGQLEFLGRLDHQVKIRGFRIEPGEVEAVLNQHPAVRESIVVACEDFLGGKGLIAFLLLKAGQTPLVIPELRRFTEQKLPAYLLPSDFAIVEDWPLTPQGKVDRRRLQVSAWRTRMRRYRGYVPAQNPLQALFVQVWEELLNQRPIGILDDFFELGGHSLLALRMVARLEHLCGRKLPVAYLFAGATIRQLSAAIMEPEANQPVWPLVQVQAGACQRALFFLHGDFQGGGVYCANLARHLGLDQPLYALSPHGVSGLSLLPTVETMAADHLARLRTVQPQGPYCLGGFCSGGLIAFEMAQQLQAQDQQVAALVLIAPARLQSRSGQSLPLAPPDLTRWSWEARRLLALRYCAQVCAYYRPRRYAGKITLLQPKDVSHKAEESLRIWKELATEVAVQFVSGNHETALSVYIQEVAEHFRQCLRSS